MNAVGDIYALLVGINHYESSTVRALQFAASDVLGFREFMRERMELAEGRCVVLTQSGESDPSALRRTSLLRALDQFTRAPMGPDDTFLFYFAGHGFALDGESFLLAADSQVDSRQLLEETAVPFRTLEKFLRQIRAGQQVVILDSCRDQPMTGTRQTTGGACDAAVTRDLAGLVSAPGSHAGGAATANGRAVLSACWEGQVSHEYPAGRHSWFCHNLLSALRETPADRVVLSTDFVADVGRRMRELAWRELQQATAQEPHVLTCGRPVALRLKPLPTKHRAKEPDASDTAALPAKLPEIPLLSVTIEKPVLRESLATSLPPIPVELLELEAEIEGLNRAIAQLEDRSHPNLQPALATLKEAQERLNQLEQEMQGNQPEISGTLLLELNEAAMLEPGRSFADLCRLAPESDPDTILRYIRRVRSVRDARQAQETVARKIESARHAELGKLQARRQAARATLDNLRQNDLAQMLGLFSAEQAEAGQFPPDAWLSFSAELAKRRYGIDRKEILAGAERAFEEEQRRQVRLAQKTAWSEAVATDTIPAFESFLARHPSASECEEARSRIELLRRKETDERNRRATEADEVAWAKVLCTNTVEAFQAYLLEHPAGRQTQKARAALSDIRKAAAEAEWNQTQQCDTIDAYEAWRARKGSTSNNNDARKRIDELKTGARAAEEQSAWEAALKLNTANAFAGFLLARPTGRLAVEARTWLAEQSAWEAALKLNAPEAFEAFLAAWPKGRQAAEARFWLAATLRHQVYANRSEWGIRTRYYFGKNK